MFAPVADYRGSWVLLGNSLGPMLAFFSSREVFGLRETLRSST